MVIQRALVSGGLNLGAQLAQEGSEGEFSPLSVALASGIGALSAPGTAQEWNCRTIWNSTKRSTFFEGKAAGMEPGLTKSGLGGLEKGSEKLIGASEGLATMVY